MSTLYQSGFRKGRWTEEEDNLLRKCVEKYGEQTWHQVPRRAGLNRCRRSCRSRWLNYLKPNIKRGKFEEDEVDLILRLRKLLGNRWSLIAARLPGRTASDVKNFWNVHCRKKLAFCKQNFEVEAQKTEIDNTKRPPPWKSSKNLSLLEGKATVEKTIQLEDVVCKPPVSLYPRKNIETMWWESLLAELSEDSFCKPSLSLCPQQNNGTLWWESLSAEMETYEGASSSMSRSDRKGTTNFRVEDSDVGQTIENNLKSEDHIVCKPCTFLESQGNIETLWLERMLAEKEFDQLEVCSSSSMVWSEGTAITTFGRKRVM